jgi:hypothetical protein
MAVKLVVAITDYDWFQTLREREDWAEVNFWAQLEQILKRSSPASFSYSSSTHQEILSSVVAFLRMQ